MWGALALPVLHRAAVAVSAVSLAPVAVPSVPMAAFHLPFSDILHFQDFRVTLLARDVAPA